MATAAKRILFSGFTFWVALAAIAIYMVYPLRKSLKMGIDLVGGTYITLEVQAQKAVEAELIEKMRTALVKLEAAQQPVPIDKKINEKDLSLELIFDSSAAAQAASIFLRSNEPELEQSTNGATVKLWFSENKAKFIMKDAVKRNVEILRSRVNRLGVSETPVFEQGDRNIIIELPDVKDPQEAKSVIGKAAVLEFKLVERQGPSEEELLYQYDGELPSNLQIVPGKLRADGRPEQYYVVPMYTDLTGKLLRNAESHFREGQMVVGFEWSPEGGEKFYDLTSRNIQKGLAIILDGVVISAPRINVAIRESGVIEGGFSPQSAKELALLLKSGSFVAPVTFEEERQVGPLLGAESIRSGLISCLVGLGLILLFSLFYYNLSGLFAFIALVYNLLLVLFGLARLGATLTLPGIAGLVLTVGMAIDASILIFERIKEEIAGGADVRRAVNQGFSHAMTVILDGNITTFIVGIVLYKFGTGPIQGFAVTMMIGIVATLITSLFFLRSIFMLLLNTMHVQKLRI